MATLLGIHSLVGLAGGLIPRASSGHLQGERWIEGGWQVPGREYHELREEGVRDAPASTASALPTLLDPARSCRRSFRLPNP